MIYLTNKARESHVENIDRIITKLNSSEDCMKGLGYKDLREVIRYLRDLQKAVNAEIIAS